MNCICDTTSVHHVVYSFHKVLFYRKLSKIKTILSFLVVLVKTFPSWSQPFIYVWFLLFSLQNYHELDSNGLSRNCFKNKDTLGIHFLGEMIIKHFFLISIFKHFGASLLCFLRASPPACQNPLLLLKFSKSRKTATYRVEPNLLSNFDKVCWAKTFWQVAKSRANTFQIKRFLKHGFEQIWNPTHLFGRTKICFQIPKAYSTLKSNGY